MAFEQQGDHFGSEILQESDQFASREVSMHKYMEQMSDLEKGEIYADTVGIVGRKHLTADQVTLLTNPILSGRSVDNRYETTIAM